MAKRKSVAARLQELDAYYEMKKFGLEKKAQTPKPEKRTIKEEPAASLPTQNPAELVKSTPPPKWEPPIEIDSDDLSDPRNYPRVSAKKPRPLVFVRMSEAKIAAFAKRGYAVICLMTLPRGEKAEELEYLRLKARGIEEGTVDASDRQIDMLKLQFKAMGLLDEQRGREVEETKKATKIRINDLLEFTPSKHTADQSTLAFITDSEKNS